MKREGAGGKARRHGVRCSAHEAPVREKPAPTLTLQGRLERSDGQAP
eukprot:CAMPEP_0179150560 /NCGR_PEP_ID=MMETSP0796-20121207/73033_1 /TAXON_ID=73915 /ORGANISM="Pyrodinium bahamense, Strain pbaha01" /LENGTH=46 /DNA_ID= /DNA_START= /DNA_END= /DNA_ORIENTATION=